MIGRYCKEPLHLQCELEAIRETIAKLSEELKSLRSQEEELQKAIKELND